MKDKSKTAPLRPLKVILFAFGIWTLVIVALAAADIFLPAWLRFPFPPMSFEKSGQFGDSFGVLSAGMAAVAAYFAYETYRASQKEVEILRRRSAEPTFLSLLERRFDLLDNISKGNLEGLHAVRNVAAAVRDAVEHNEDQKKMATDYMSEASVSGLRNYFRYTYHIIRFAEELFGFDPTLQGADQRKNGAYPYVRLLRAQLSDSELLLIALNTLYIEDGKDFSDLIHRYGLLNNMLQKDLTTFGFKGRFEADAFGWPAVVGPATSWSRGVAVSNPA